MGFNSAFKGLNFQGDGLYLWGFSMNCVSCDRPSAYKFEVTPSFFLENLCTPGYGYYFSTEF